MILEPSTFQECETFDTSETFGPFDIFCFMSYPDVLTMNFISIHVFRCLQHVLRVDVCPPGIFCLVLYNLPRRDVDSSESLLRNSLRMALVHLDRACSVLEDGTGSTCDH